MKRMSLQSITGKPETEARRILIYGPPGVGKTTLAADAPGAIVLPIEDGLVDIDAPRFPRPETWDEALEAIDTLGQGGHDFKTLVVDTVSSAETLAHRKLIAGTKWDTVERWEGGFNKWRQGILDVAWRPLLARLDTLRAKTGMTIVLLAHSTVKAVRDPESEGWDQYQLQLEPLAGSLLVAWSDIVAFYRFEDVRVVEGKARGVHTGRRLLHSEHSATAVAKNRTGLPPVLEVPIERPWSVLSAHLEQRSPDALKAELVELAKRLPPDVAQKALDAAKGADGNRLHRIVNHARALVAREGAAA